MDKAKDLLQRFLELFGDRGDEECEHGGHCQDCDPCIKYDNLINETETYLKKLAQTENGTPSQDPVTEILQEVEGINPDAMFPTDMREAIIGYVERFGMQPVILLDKEKCMDILMKYGMPEDEAVDFFYFNTIGSWMGEGTPCFATIDKSLI